MNIPIMALVVFVALSILVPAPGAAQLGQVTVPISCAPAVQAKFERGVAMLHSYWFTQARQTFEAVLKQDDYYAKLVALSKNADTVRPELARAKALLPPR